MPHEFAKPLVLNCVERNGNTLPTSRAFPRKSRLFGVVIRSKANVCLFWARCVATARSGLFCCVGTPTHGLETVGSVADLLNAGRVLAGLVRRLAPVAGTETKFHAATR
jgi:hypothetical protein